MREAKHLAPHPLPALPSLRFTELKAKHMLATEKEEKPLKRRRNRRKGGKIPEKEEEAGQGLQAQLLPAALAPGCL